MEEIANLGEAITKSEDKLDEDRLRFLHRTRIEWSKR
jgi:hypothetical protein